MRLGSLLLTFAILATTNSIKVAAGAPADHPKLASTDWPWWRGPNRDGVADSDQHPPVEWDKTTNVLWKIPIPGRGHSSPTVVGKHVYLPTADRKRDVQSILCIDRETGRQIWETIVHRGGLMNKNKKASQASPTVACDGDRIIMSFLNDGAVHATALDLNGKQQWQTKISDYVIHQGYGASPAIYGPLVLVAADNKGGGAIAGLNRNSGEIVWKHERPRKPNYASPIILFVAGRDQLLFTGCDLASSFNPLTGEKIWEIEGATTECVTSTVTDGELIYTSGGYPRNHISAVKADGSGEVVWENNDRVYVPSLLVRDGRLYGVLDAGVAACWDCKTGKELWKKRLGGVFSASPVLIGDRIYATNEEGETFIFQASPEKYIEIARNKLGTDVYATPTIVDNRIYMRVADLSGDERQEFLYCLGIVPK